MTDPDPNVTSDPDAKHDARGGADATDRDRIAYDPNSGHRGLWLSVALGLLGIWSIVGAVVLEVGAAEFWNAVLVGATLLAIGAYNAYRRRTAELGSAGLAVFAAILGLWLVASPFVVGPGEGALAATSEVGAWNDLVVGVLAVAIGGYSAAKTRDRRRAADARETATFDRRGQ